MLATPVVFWSGAGFHRVALQAARHLTATMDTLISLGTLAAYTWSIVVLVGGLDEDTYFEVAAVITTLILLGRYLEALAKRRSGEAIRALLELGAKDAHVLRDGSEVDVAIEDAACRRPDGRAAGGEDSDRRRRRGGRLGRRPVVADGRAGPRGGRARRGGRRSDDQHLRPTHGPRDPKVGSETALAQIGRLVEAAQSGKAPVQRLADRVSEVFVPIVIVLSLVTLVGWLAFGGTAAEAFTAAVAVLDHRVPVRARPGDADRDHGRKRKGRAARNRGQGA